MISITQVITQYNDLFSDLCTEIHIDTEYPCVIDFKLDIWIKNSLKVQKNYCYGGNFGRTAGFPSLRFALETLVTTVILELDNSRKYKDKTIEFLRDIPSPKIIIKYVQKCALDKILNADSIRRMYDCHSVIVQLGLRTDEYFIRFFYYYIGIKRAYIGIKTARFYYKVMKIIQIKFWMN